MAGSQSTEAEPLGANDEAAECSEKFWCGFGWRIGEAGSAGLESLMTSALVACAGARALKGANLTASVSKWQRHGGHDHLGQHPPGGGDAEDVCLPAGSGICSGCPDTAAHDPTSRGFAICMVVAAASRRVGNVFRKPG